MGTSKEADLRIGSRKWERSRHEVSVSVIFEVWSPQLHGNFPSGSLLGSQCVNWLLSAGFGLTGLAEN